VLTPLPSEKEEVWRYSPIDRLDLDAFAPPAAATAALPAAARAVLEEISATVGAVAGRIFVHNGFPEPPEAIDLPPGVQLGRVADVSRAGDLIGSVQHEGDALVRLNDAFAPDAVLVDVPDNVEVGKPILIVHWCEGVGVAAFPRTAVRVGVNASASVIEVYAGALGTAPMLVVPVTELAAGNGGHLDYVSLQVLGDTAWFIDRLAAAGGQDTTVRTFTVGLGGAYDRVRADVRAEGKGGRSEILSAYLGNGTQVHDVRTLQDHVAPRTESELLCQGAVAGSSRSVYSGLIRVHRGAVRTDARQTNHNLVLDEGAHADSVPNLDILENDVKCSHASTVGPIDEDQRYYIESRGVAPEVAEGLIVRGFFDAIVERGPVPAATPLLRREINHRLDRALGSGEGASV
jgi:Fe-S cluster assembly protein SufD